MVSSFLRPLTTASLLSAAVAASAVSSQSPLKLSVHSSYFPVKHSHLYSAPVILASAPGAFKAVSNSVHPSTILHMESAAIDVNSSDSTKRVLPELLTEFMVDMTCEGCVSAVKNNIQKLDGVRVVDVDLSNQVVRVIGSIPVRTMLDSVEQTGRKARLIGQGNPNDFLVSAAVAEFKGPDIFGVVRLAQVNMELTRIEASFSGLSPGKHGWSINEYGDLTRGVASTGIVFDPTNCLSEKPLGDLPLGDLPLGDLGTLEASENGEAHFSDSKQKLRVSDLIGRSIAVYEKEDKSDPGIAAAVIARSAGVGENYKKVCTCDGVTIWESS